MTRRRAIVIAAAVIGALGVAALGAVLLLGRGDDRIAPTAAVVPAAWSEASVRPGHAAHVGRHSMACRECHEMSAGELRRPVDAACDRCHAAQAGAVTLHVGAAARSARACGACHGFRADASRQDADCAACPERPTMPALGGHRQGCTERHRTHEEPSLAPRLHRLPSGHRLPRWSVRGTSSGGRRRMPVVSSSAPPGGRRQRAVRLLPPAVGRCADRRRTDDLCDCHLQRRRQLRRLPRASRRDAGQRGALREVPRRHGGAPGRGSPHAACASCHPPHAPRALARARAAIHRSRRITRPRPACAQARHAPAAIRSTRASARPAPRSQQRSSRGASRATAARATPR